MIAYDNELCIVDDQYLDDFRKISDTRIEKLNLDDKPNLMVFPQDINLYGDKLSENKIISLQGNTLHTGNIMGYIGVNQSELTIKSRFAKNCDQDYFLHYMLQKVFCFNLFDLKHRSDEENIFDFIIYLFPYYLKKAVNQGLFKCYLSREYNDANVKGRIDVSRHIRENIPFRCQISYVTREHCYDNHITQLIRHTIEHIKLHPMGSAILHSDPDTYAAINQITYATPSYDRNCRTSIINKNIRQLHHPYFFEYMHLQQLCIKILRHEGFKYGHKKDEIYGILFDGAWLWEEYLNTILMDCGFEHPQNKTRTKAIHIFEEPKSCPCYPDFHKNDIILDAKYKRLRGKNADRIDRDDMYQLISYMYIQQASIGGFIYPLEHNNENRFDSLQNLGKLKGYEGHIKLIGLNIPYCDASKNFKNFIDDMIFIEQKFKKEITESLLNNRKTSIV